MLAEDAPYRGQVGAVGPVVVDRRAEVVTVAAVQDSHVVAALDEPPHDLAPHELRAADDEDSHPAMIVARELYLAGESSNLRGLGSACSLLAFWAASSWAVSVSIAAGSEGSFSAATRRRRRSFCSSWPSPVDHATE